ncbi:MAG: hypothetical protein WBZ36_04675, partial [Candidatus Nitrosopolaris sp.]
MSEGVIRKYHSNYCYCTFSQRNVIFATGFLNKFNKRISCVRARRSQIRYRISIEKSYVEELGRQHAVLSILSIIILHVINKGKRVSVNQVMTTELKVHPSFFRE